MQNGNQLLRTKLRLPFIRSGYIFRPRLQEKIWQGLRCPLTLITSPAGFGKTTLVASCLNGCGLKVAWLSLDKDDNQIQRFLTYLLAAISTASDQLGNDAAELMVEIQQTAPEDVLASLINDLDNAGTEIALVLDDYQFINSQAIHSALIFLLDHCPPTFHLIIATRSDPPLPLARLRSRGQMVELRAVDLRFTSEEAGEFLNNVMGLHLDGGSIEVLEERTEGWIAGLQLASIALQAYLSTRDGKDIHGFINGFSGTNRYILDYLLEEVLSNQSSAIQFFLLCTSILERLTAPLCQAVLQEIQSAVWSIDRSPANVISVEPTNSQVMLESLERANLFLVGLDDERKWYRYHHLFAELLRSRLNQLYPGLEPRLHTLASAWYEANQFYEEAIHHALAAKDYPGAARLVEAVAENAWLNGQYASILAWTKAIPTELVHIRPWLCIWNAWAFTQFGVYQDIDRWVTLAEQAIIKRYGDLSSCAAPDESLEFQALRMEISALQVFLVSFSRDYHRAIALGEAFVSAPQFFDKKGIVKFTRCNILHLLSSMFYSIGDLKKAEQASLEAVDLAKEMRFVLRLLHCTNKLILINNVYGNLNRSFQQIEETRTFLQQQGFSAYFAGLQLDFRKLELLYEWNQMGEFQQRLEFATKQAALLNVPYLTIDSANIRAQDLLIKRDYHGAQAALDQVTAVTHQFYIWEALTWRTERLQVRLWLESGDLSAAVAWASQQVIEGENTLHFPSETQTVARARILLAQGMYQESVSLLDQISVSAEIEGRQGSLIEIHILRAIAFLGLKKWDQADAEMQNALALAEPQRYVRTFLDEGDIVSTLLSRVAKNAASPHVNYALRLLNAFEEKAGSKLPVPPGAWRKDDPRPLANTALIEPLSRRELEILHLLAEGKTNQEIAQRLIIANGTVKAHAANIYRKLDVANRTEAVTRARQLGILP